MLLAFMMIVMGVEDDDVNDLWYFWNLADTFEEIVIDLSGLSRVEVTFAYGMLWLVFNNPLHSRLVRPGLR